VTDIRVLIVDDDPGARSLHSRFVAEIDGFSVAAVAGTGEAALEHCRHAIDLVLLDMRLPGISGIEVLHRLRTLGPDGPDVIVISSSRDQVTVRQALAAHVVGYLIKPFTADVLQQRLQAYAAQRRASADEVRDRPLGQGEIDLLLSTGRVRVPPRSSATRSAASSSGAEPHGVGSGSLGGPLPKGLAEVTLARVLSALDPVTPISAAEVAAASGISRATARRYLDYLLSDGSIDLAHHYGRRGRPTVLYRLAPAPPG